MLAAAAYGLAFGFIGSIPIAGPVSALVFRCGVDGRFDRGRGIAVGAAVAEAVYAFLAFWGFSAVLARYEFVVPLSKIVGGLLLMALGATFLRRPATGVEPPAVATKIASGKSFLLGLGITGLNPTMIATWTAVAATLYGMGLARFTTPSAAAFAVGVAFGITLWFVLLLWLLQHFRERFEARVFDRLVRGMGIIIFGMGAWFLLSLIPGVEPM